MDRVHPHSRPQSPRSLWSAPGIETSGRDRSRKSANHGLPAFVRSLRNLNNNGYYRLQKWAAIALARYLVPARGLDPWRRPKGSWALGTRMVHPLRLCDTRRAKSNDWVRVCQKLTEKKMETRSRQPRTQAPLSSSLEKVPWFRLVTWHPKSGC